MTWRCFVSNAAEKSLGKKEEAQRRIHPFKLDFKGGVALTRLFEAEAALRRGSEGDPKKGAANEVDEDVPAAAEGGKRKFSSFFDHGTLKRFHEMLGRNVPKVQKGTVSAT